MTVPSISVVVCTRNRADELRACLASLGAQTLPGASFEVIVVDNGSTDATREVVQATRLPAPIRYVAEPVVGLSQARNAGWRQARADCVAFLDDDAVAAADWLARLLACFRDVVPSPAAVGGSVALIWTVPRPDWVTRGMAAHLGLVDWDFGPGPLQAGRGYLAGSNMAFAREALEATGGFDTALGRKDALLLSNEELLVQRRMMARGWTVYYDPRIAIGHRVHAERVSPQWFHRRYYWQGVSDVVLEIRQAGEGIGRRSGPLAVARDLVGVGRALLASMPVHVFAPDQRVAARCRVHEWLGRLACDLGVVARPR